MLKLFLLKFCLFSTIIIMFEQIARKQECTYTNTELECKSMLQTEKWHSAQHL
jgi:hypothetical protein